MLGYALEQCVSNRRVVSLFKGGGPHVVGIDACVGPRMQSLQPFVAVDSDFKGLVWPANQLFSELGTHLAIT